MACFRLALVSLVLVSVRPYSCHKPTALEEYRDGTKCFGAFDANLQQLSGEQMRAARVDRYAVELAKEQIATGVFDLGRSLERNPWAVNEDLRRAVLSYRRSHSWQRAGDGHRMFSGLGVDFNECLRDFYGRPND